MTPFFLYVTILIHLRTIY